VELMMHAHRYTKRGLALAAAAALLITTAWAATAATAAPGGAIKRETIGGDLATPGWRVVKTFGPDRRPVSGLLTAVSANDAWSAWSGSISFVEHWTGGAWRPVTMPPKVAAAVWWPVSLGAAPGGEVWLFSAPNPTVAIRHTGGKWVLQPIPRWVLRPSSGTISATTAVFGPGNVWVFSLGAGAYAAHYNGHSWAKVAMPEAPDGVSAVAPGDIWAVGPDISFVMHWNGAKWVKVRLPLLPLPFGATVSYSNITAVGPRDAWLMRTISYKSTPPSTAMMHWNGSAWLTVASPADIIGSLVPDGHGGLWADGIDINPGGFWFIYHLAGGRWTQFTPPGVFIHSPEYLTLIPGTRSVWATGSNFNAKGYFGVILKYGP
jgi:hypothetical protein